MNDDTVSKIQELIKHVFFDVMDIAGRVFVAIAYSDMVKIGTRGFLAEEKERGLVLVFNKQMNFQWQDEGINTSLIFNGTLHKCFIPISNIMAIYSPELKLQFVIEPLLLKKEQSAQEEAPLKNEKKELKDAGNKIVQVDFTKKRK